MLDGSWAYRSWACDARKPQSFCRKELTPAAPQMAIGCLIHRVNRGDTAQSVEGTDICYLTLNPTSIPKVEDH